MTVRKAEEFLRGLRLTEKQIYRKLDEIDELTAIAESCTVSTDKDCVQGNGDSDKISMIVSKIEDLETEVRSLRQILSVNMQTFNNVTMLMTNKHEKKVLFYNFVQGMHVYDIAVKMDISDNKVKKIKSKGIKNFARLCP